MKELGRNMKVRIDTKDSASERPELVMVITEGDVEKFALTFTLESAKTLARALLVACRKAHR